MRSPAVRDAAERFALDDRQGIISAAGVLRVDRTTAYGVQMTAQRIALVATMRNEGPFILEWVAYHRHIGFTEMLVCTNDCVDGSPDLLDLLERRGLVRHLRCSPAANDKAQLHAYAQATASLEPSWPDVLMVLDADEFLNIHVGDGKVPALLASTPEATAWLVNWRTFGASGHEHWAPDLVLKRFTRAAPLHHGVNWSFKTLFTHPEAYHCPLLPHGPGFARAECVGGLRPVDGGGHRLPSRYARSEQFLQTEPGQVTWSLAQVNHYNTRSWQDYLVKHDRGGGLGPERWARDENWETFNRNEEQDLSIQRHLPAVESAITALLADDEIRAAHLRCCASYGDHVLKLDRVAA
ncbi:glycosyltransferase family 2 protein [uncultured Sphingomonas sp.]|uniref:glycosyltransferase family 2 protein n=1 Tax=uncultured Sphingomonas sp. TaxID=158754 RepID=UPI0035CC4373